MSQVIFQVDAFTSSIFQGNPAAVLPLRDWLADDLLQSIAMENNLSETAYFIPLAPNRFRLRWFTPAKEVRLCGHATLAAGHVLYEHLMYQENQIFFDTLAGELRLQRQANGYQLDFPSDPPQAFDSALDLSTVLGICPKEVYTGTDDLLVILDQESDVVNLSPNFRLIGTLKKRGIIVSAPGKSCDFVSRCFYPRFGIDEDPVTGSAHTLLTPYWADKLQKMELHARQLSPRGGTLNCTLKDDRVLLGGQAVTYLVGEIKISTGIM